MINEHRNLSSNVTRQNLQDNDLAQNNTLSELSKLSVGENLNFVKRNNTTSL